MVIVNDAFAHECWPDESPLGQRLRFTDDPDQFVEVVGVVKTIKNSPFRDQPQPFIYLALSQSWTPNVSLLVRGTGDPMNMLPAVHGVIREIDPNIVPLSTRSMSVRRP